MLHIDHTLKSVRVIRVRSMGLLFNITREQCGRNKRKKVYR